MNAVRPLVIRFGAMGDMVLLTGLLQALHRRFGLPCDLVSSGGWTRPLLHANPDLGHLQLLTSRKRPYPLAPEQWRLVGWLRQRARGPVYVCDYLSRDKLRWLLARARILPADCVFLMPEMVPPQMHWFDVWKVFSEMTPGNFSGYPNAEDNYPAFPKLLVDDNSQADLQSFLQDRRISGPLILLQPGNKRTLKRGRLGSIGDHKSWPSSHWIELCRALIEQRPDASLMLCGAPPEQALLREIAAGSGSARVHALGDQLPIPRLLALLTRAHSLISIDSGPAHAGAALGCPSVVLFGAIAMENWLPRGAPSTPVIGLEAPPSRPRRVDEISVARVLDAWRSLAG